MNGKILKGNQIYVGRAQNKAERQSELKHKFEQIRQGKLARCEGANLYVKNLEDDIDNRRLKREFSLFGTITSARVMMEAGSSKGFGFVCYTSPEEANKAIMAMNGKILIAKPLYVAIAQSKEECQAFLTKTYIERMVALKDGGYPILNTCKPVRTSSRNCVPTHSQPQRGSELPCKPVVRTKRHASPNIHYSIHSAAVAPKPSFSISRTSQGGKSACHITNTTQTMAVHPQTSALGRRANQRFKKVAGAANVRRPLKFKVGKPASIQKPVPVCMQDHDMLNVSILASARRSWPKSWFLLFNPFTQLCLKKSLEYCWRWMMLKFFIWSNILSLSIPKLMNSSSFFNPTKLKILP